MKNYTYKFADGMKSVVEVDDELYGILIEMDRQEKYGNRREPRRHVSLETLTEMNVEPSYTDEYNFDEIFGGMDNERLQEAISQLLPTQQSLLNRLFVERQTVSEIAEKDGVAVCSISNRLARIYKKLKNFL